MTNTRKPEPPVTKSAYEKVNQFIQDEGILLALSKPQISSTDKDIKISNTDTGQIIVSFPNGGQVVIGNPNIMALYKDDVIKENKEGS